MRKETVDVLSDAPNAVVLQVPFRKFPGILVQGDTLSVFCEDLAEIAILARSDLTDPKAANELREAVEELSKQFDALKAHYISSLGTHGLRLPFSDRADR